MSGDALQTHAATKTDNGSDAKKSALVADQASCEATVDLWTEKLRSYRAQLAQDPQTNPIKQLALDISRQLELKKLGQSDLADLTKTLCDRALIRRAEKTRRYMGSTDEKRIYEKIRSMVRDTAFENAERVDFKTVFKPRWETPNHGIVFTAHPTFVMSEGLRTVLVNLVDAGGIVSPDTRRALGQVPHRPDAKITLSDEHRQAQEAIQNAQAANGILTAIVLEIAQEVYPADWHLLCPKPLYINSWVGYDLDGRTDISWYHSIYFRLREKQRQLSLHAEAVAEARKELSGSIASELEHLSTRFSDAALVTKCQADAFFGELNNPEAVSFAANLVTKQVPGGIHNTLKDVDKQLRGLIKKAIADAPPDRDTGGPGAANCVMALAKLRANIAQQGLGTARMHFRINAMQLHNAVRVQFGRANMGDLSSRVLLDRLDNMISNTKPEQISFATIDVERATAIRQFQVIAQIIKHIDSDAQIRLLIAETEHAFTVLAALFFAKTFGTLDNIDISPLFETEDALEYGAQVIEILLKTRSYRSYIEARGQLCVQTGFSDAGRFIGQVPAALAIERLQSKLSQVLADENMTGIDVLIFDTHGESMGRGAHPASLDDRFKYVLSPWVRNLYAKRGTRLIHEASFQGGDGYVLFGSKNLALATMSAMLRSEDSGDSDPKNDSFYRDFAFSMDNFLRVKSYQTRLFENEDYREALGALGVSLLSKSGSRKSKRQFDAGGDKRSAPAEMRAIPHNAILQQMGFVLNIISGIGSAVRYDRERFVEVYKNSDRIRRIMRLVANARQISSIKTLVAYASLFDDAYWVTRPLNGMENHIKGPCLYLADLLRGDSRHDGIMHLATLLREDDVHLSGLFTDLGVSKRQAEDEGRDELDILHAIRLALIQHIYLLAAQIPPFSAQNNFTLEQVMKNVLSLNIDEAVAMLRTSYPKSGPQIGDYDVDEDAEYEGEDDNDYLELNRQLIDPIDTAYETIKEVGIGISHHFRAHG